MKLNKKQILEYQQNRDPYLMVDYVTEVSPGKFSNGYKILKPDEWFFKVHWEITQICRACYKLKQWFKCHHLLF